MANKVGSFLQKYNAIAFGDEPMSRHTTFRIGGPAKAFVCPRNPDELRSALIDALDSGLKVRALGIGSNVLVKDAGTTYAVFCLNSMRLIAFKSPAVNVGAGFPLGILISQCGKKALSGVEVLAGIPGTLGGAVMMNAGGKYGCIGDVVENATVMDMEGNTRKLTNQEIGFGNRSSLIKTDIIVEVRLNLKWTDSLSIRKKASAIIDEKRASQPMSLPSAGCVFKNPPGKSAGALIDQAGLKGRRVGGAMISTLHANYIVNDANAKASDVLKLIDIIRDEVRKQFDTELELEIKVW